MAKENARDNLLEAISRERAKSNPSKNRLARLQGQLRRIGGEDVPAKNPDAVSVRNLPKPAKNPDAVSVRNLPKPAKNPDAVSVRNLPKPAKNPDAVSVRNLPKPAMNPDVLKAANLLKNTPRGSDAPITRSTSGTGTRKAQPRSKPNPPRRPTAGGNMIAATPPGGGTLSKKDVDEYSEAFASPDADKMYNLSEKNRRKDMNMLERAFDSIKVAGDRATADRKKRGLSDYDMNEDVFGSRSGGGIEKTMKKKKSSVRKRAAKRGFGVETRGN